MTGKREFLEFVGDTLGVPAETLTLETTYGSLPEWDSMAQLRLVMEIGAKYGTEIPFADVTGVRSLWEFWRRINGVAVKKVIAVDLDNTLWDGVVGEDGLGGIRPKTAFQRELKRLKERGVLLVALSKNNAEDVSWLFGEAAGGKPEGMALGAEDFVAWRTDWNGKAENLRAIADELNLGTDAFVFVDDNPAERMEMEMRLPEVTVAEFPPRLEAYFPERELTEEDRTKTEQYRAEAKRKRLFAELPDGKRDEASLFDLLGVRLDVHEMKADEAARVAQLSQKANQFDVCTNRYGEADVRRLAAEGLVVTAHAGDRFGDQGLVAFVIVTGNEIVDWVMSCRVMGRGIEERIQRAVEDMARARGMRELGATWRNSGKNRPVRELFDRFGFELTESSDQERRYRRKLTQASVR